jgi:hypothetical protein
MPDLSFAVESAAPVRAAAAPLSFRLRISDRAAERALIQSVALRCQIRIEPARRKYDSAEQVRLLDLFGEPERWGKTVRDLLWAHVNVEAPAFTRTAEVELPVPCDFDCTHAAVKYFDALETGEVPLIFLFSGTVFYEAPGIGTQVCLIPWDREARYRLPVAVWKSLFAEVPAP